MQEDIYNKLRKESWDRALDAFGFAYIFNKRINKYTFRLRLLTFFGLVVPASVGALALSYSFNNSFLTLIIAIAVPATIIQFIVSVFSVVYKWDDSLSYSLEASRAHAILSDNFRRLGNTPPETYDELKKAFDLLNTEYTQRTMQDVNAAIKDWEKRMGMKAGLREFQRTCIGCHTAPLSLKNTACEVCGNFSFWNKLFNN